MISFTEGTCEVDVEALFAGVNVTMVKDIAGWGTYWPQYGINTLQTLQPGSAYYVLMAENNMIYFPPCGEFKTGSVRNETGVKEMLMESPWAYFSGSPISHTIAFITDAVGSILQVGDFIGAFDEMGNCYGVVRWDGQNALMTVFGDDPSTAEKDGFVQGEAIRLKHFDGSSATETVLNISWDGSLPQSDGTFAAHGISAIQSITQSITGMETTRETVVNIFPNPARNVVNIAFGAPKTVNISILDVHGKTVLKQTVFDMNNQLDISALSDGMYVIKIEGDEIFRLGKIIKR
jgi:hypothetical protein